MQSLLKVSGACSRNVTRLENAKMKRNTLTHLVVSYASTYKKRIFPEDVGVVDETNLVQSIAKIFNNQSFEIDRYQRREQQAISVFETIVEILPEAPAFKPVDLISGSRLLFDIVKDRLAFLNNQTSTLSALVNQYASFFSDQHSKGFTVQQLISGQAKCFA